MTDKEFLDKLNELSKKITPGDWKVWDGPAYVSGAKDLCIGAGDNWLYNMDHPECRAGRCHMEIPEPGCEHPPCELNPDKIKKYKQKYLSNNKEKTKEYSKRYYKDNIEKEKIRKKEYRKRNKTKINVYAKNKYHNDANYKMSIILRNRIRIALNRKDIIKEESSLDLTGCSILELKEHLEKQFKEGMNWSNHGTGEGKWHIDHILPCDSFDLTSTEEQKKCFHYTNLQPLWAKDNLKKSNKY